VEHRGLGARTLASPNYTFGDYDDIGIPVNVLCHLKRACRLTRGRFDYQAVGMDFPPLPQDLGKTGYDVK
jgi:hypothetical protein